MLKFSERRCRLREKMKEAGVDSLLVTSVVNVTYLTGFTGDSSYFLLSPSGEVLITDFRYITQLEEECPGLSLRVRGTAEKMFEVVKELVEKQGLKALALEAESISLSLYNTFCEEIPSLELSSTKGLVEGLRDIKDASEIAEIRQAVHYAERALAVIRASLRPEQTELEVAHALENQIRLFGGRGCSFPPIVAVGPNAALPHAQPGKRKIGDDPILLIDWGAWSHLYASDLTRVFVTGTISPKLETIYRVVLEAQLAAIEAIRPGEEMQAVDSVARNIIAKAGFGEKFGHGLGHGLGMQVHEAPRLGQKQDRKIEAGMVITVEPGIYLPGWGGVRIEDDVLVTENGAEVLSSYPKSWESCIVKF